MGSSLALALRAAGYVEHVTGCGRALPNLQKGVELGVLDDFQPTIDKAIQNADMVVIAVPLGAMRSVFEQIKPSLSTKTIITDVGSAKASVVQDAREILGHQFSQFVPGHPIAGTERSGVEAGFASLFQQRKIILTPDDATSVDAFNVVSNMWAATGGEVESMSVEHHDQILAATSHLPHMLAFSLVSYLSKMTHHDEIFSYAAGGFRDFTRIASSDPVMWRDVCLANGDALVDLIRGFKMELDEIINAIQQQDSDALFDSFRDAKHTRDQLRKL
jgi:prephenate dehydrogenase